MNQRRSQASETSFQHALKGETSFQHALKGETSFQHALKGDHHIMRRWRVRWLYRHLPKRRSLEKANQALVAFLRSSCRAKDHRAKDHENIAHIYYFKNVRWLDDSDGRMRYRILGKRVVPSRWPSAFGRWKVALERTIRRWRRRYHAFGRGFLGPGFLGMGVHSSSMTLRWKRPVLRPALQPVLRPGRIEKRNVRHVPRRTLLSLFNFGFLRSEEKDRIHRPTHRPIHRPILEAGIEKSSTLRTAYRPTVAVEDKATEDFRSVQRLKPSCREKVT